MNTNKANSLIIFIIKVNAVIILLCNCSQMLLLWTGGSQDREWYCSVCVVRPRLIVITPQPHDGRRVLLISTDHIPLADWAINESVVIPQSAAQRPLLSHSPSSDPLIKFKGSPGVAKSPFPLCFYIHAHSSSFMKYYLDRHIWCTMRLLNTSSCLAFVEQPPRKWYRCESCCNWSCCFAEQQDPPP